MTIETARGIGLPFMIWAIILFTMYHWQHREKMNLGHWLTRTGIGLLILVLILARTALLLNMPPILAVLLVNIPFIPFIIGLLILRKYDRDGNNQFPL